ncbi:MAG: cupin protein [Haloplasmataceae bacterium]|jgi:quercetin dioxygenase-like cupin family protein|nr:cupin protein [Haloplasmataceae bacterium]
MEVKNFFMNLEVELQDLGNGISRKILAYNDNLMIVEVSFDKGSVGTLHSHPHEQITYILEGEFEFTINGVKKVVKAGDSMYKQPNIIHGAICLKKGKLLDIFTPHREDFLKK